MQVPLARSALKYAAIWSLGASAVALVAGAVRVLPWVLEPDVPWRVALPFARTLAAVALEAAILVGAPIGVALACGRFADRGEARVLELLGERPSRTTLRLMPQALVFAALVAIASALGGMDASAPGRVATSLVQQGKASCEHTSSRTTYSVPLVGVTWLCSPTAPARLYGHGPGGMSKVTFTAQDAHIAGDMRRIDLDEATLVLGDTKDAPQATLHTFTLRGLSPWATASTLAPWTRATVMGSSALVCVLLSAWGVLRRMARSPLAVLLVGAAGPLAALGLVRAMERADARTTYFLLVPAIAAMASVLALVVTARIRGRHALHR
jgi:hypothetical protein